MEKKKGGCLKWAVIGILGVFVLGLFVLGQDDKNEVTGAISQEIVGIFNGTTTTISSTAPADTTQRIVVPEKVTTEKVTTTKKVTTAKKVTTTKKPTTAKKTTTTRKPVVTQPEVQKHEYVLNTNTGKFHYADCGDAKRIKEKNRQDYYGTRNEVIDLGYIPCAKCNP